MRKKLVQINTVCNGSTGKIMCDIALKAKECGFDTYCFFGRGNSNENVNCIKIGNKISVYFHALIARLGFNPYGSYFSTKKLIKKIKKINPDVIHMHNIHGYYLNFPSLFKFLKKVYKGKIMWTLHDCWAFTGHCSHFTLVKCDKWQKECHNCPQLSIYPKEYFDTTNSEFKLKKKLFLGLNNLTIITPSEWLNNLIKKSFLKEYPCKVINNGVDLKVFNPQQDDNIYEKYNIPRDKKIILGIASAWGPGKGLYDFIELATIITKKYKILLVGVDNKTQKILPDNIISIKRTENAKDLAALYSISHVLFNPTYEDNYPTVNLESIACHTPVVTYDTGGCKETIGKNGLVIRKKDYKSLIEFCDSYKKTSKKVNLERLDKEKKFKEYIDLY